MREPGSNSSDNIRSFVCIEVPEYIRSRIGALQDDLRAEGAQISWVRPTNIHLTIKFLGDVRASRIPNVTEAIMVSAAEVGPFEIEISGTGCFPSARNARVLWVGLSTVPYELHRLHTAIEDELARNGFEREGKKFAPHLTIGRVRSPKRIAGVTEKLLALGFAPEKFQVTELILMRSDLNPSGSVYSYQAVIPLQSPTPS